MLKKLFKRLNKYTFLIIVILVLAIINVMTTLAIPILIGEAVDLIVGVNDVDFEAIKPILGYIAICIVVSNLFGYLYEYLMSIVSEGFILDLRKETFNKLTYLPLSYIDNKRQGDLVSLLISDIEQVSNGTYFTKQAKVKGILSGYVLEMVTNQKNVKSMCYEDRSIDEFKNINQDLYNVGVNAQFVSSTTNPSTRFVNGLVYALVGIVGAIFVIINPVGFQIGQLSSFLSYANQYTKPFNEISGVISEVQSAFASFKRVVTLLEEPNEVDEGTNEIVLPIDKVEFRHVEFSYVKEQQLITDFNLTIKQGQKVAIVGPTGCGKTTMINLLLRYYDPVSGGIYIDDVNTLDIKKNSLRKAYGLVLQDTWIFRGTVRENIAYAKPEATLEEVIEAAKLAHAHSFIKRLPNGYDTVISATSGLSQ